MKTLTYTETLPAKLNDLWKELTDHTKITKWFSPQAKIEPHQGGAYELYFDPENHDSMSTKGCKITAIKPCTYIAFQWKGPDQYAQIMNNPPQTSVEVTIAKKEQGTQLTLKHSGWKEGAKWEEAKEWHHKAWLGVLESLKKHLD